MGKYNFDEIIDRRGTSCNKWEYNVPEDVVPMWVADMDFAAAPEIREAMQKRLDHPVYGYTHHSKELKDAIVSWVGKRYHWDIQSEWLGFSPGVVPALVMSLLSLTTPGVMPTVESLCVTLRLSIIHSTLRLKKMDVLSLITS